MKSQAFFRGLSQRIEGAINLAELNASHADISVQSDRVVVQLSFRGLPNDFGEKTVLTIAEKLSMQLKKLESDETQFSALPYSISDPQRLWIFFKDDYGWGSILLCDCRNGKIDWNIPKE